MLGPWCRVRLYHLHDLLRVFAILEGVHFVMACRQLTRDDVLLVFTARRG